MSDINNIKDLSQFAAAKDSMISTNQTTYGNRYNRGLFVEKVKEYKPEEIARIIANGNLEEQVRLSRNYFNRGGFYKRIILHYATLLLYQYLLIPHPASGQSLQTAHIKKRYENALQFLDKMSLEAFFTDISREVFECGAYYGIVAFADKNSFAVIDLPHKFCRTRYKDTQNVSVVEFNLSYFDSFTDQVEKEERLKTFPDFIASAYRRWKKNQNPLDAWVLIPSDIGGVCFTFFDGRPPFLSIIPDTLKYDEALENENAKEADEIKKIIVQQIPHLADGRLLFEPDEAKVMHQGAVGMLKHNPNVSVLTSYADVESIGSNTATSYTSKTVENNLNRLYAEAGVSSQIFSAEGSSTIEYSLQNDLDLVMYMAHKYEQFVKALINRVCGNSNIQFSFKFLPTASFNQMDYAAEALKQAQFGYSALLPSIILGVNQRDLVDLKAVENDVYDLANKMLVPLQSANTQAAEGEEAGRPTKKQTDKSDKTVANEKAKDKH